ncbi:Pimeloyl-ACP methyl ester carboxylesterase [Amycolatopsis xylanica]|uniref:Pimeloyl-ACP methyl ester carboxylesterase n=1 Tax=Amycolatopsis xylanica TaxID=589385 RepID=A0A1H3LTG7_9PSEU|nr:Pimeloyl-ACP methyl ester carboxylesterase [Amycolatopsis xylanica]
MLALHGFPQEAARWDGLARLLASRGVRVIAFDQRGYGARPPLDTYGLDAFVGDALAVADARGLDRFDVAGFGVGAMQAWTLASRHPERVRSLTTIRYPHPAALAHGLRTDPAQAAAWAKLDRFTPPEPAARALLADGARGLREFLRESGMDSALIARTVARLGSVEALSGALAWNSVTLDELAAVPKTTVPTLFFHSAGPALTTSTASRCADWVTGPFRAVGLAGAGHWILETCPERLLEPLLARLGVGVFVDDPLDLGQRPA